MSRRHGRHALAPRVLDNACAVRRVCGERLQHAPLGAKHAQSGAVLPRELRLIARTTAATTAATAAAAVTTAAATTAASTAAATAATTTAAAATTAAATTAAATARLPPPLLLPSLLLPTPLLPSPLLPSPLASLCRGRMSATSSTRQWAGRTDASRRAEAHQPTTLPLWSTVV